MTPDSGSNPLSERARLSVDVPLSDYLEMVRRSKGKCTKSQYVAAALTHYAKCPHTMFNLLSEALDAQRQESEDTDTEEGPV